jgi:hypothetical protein
MFPDPESGFNRFFADAVEKLDDEQALLSKEELIALQVIILYICLSVCLSVFVVVCHFFCLSVCKTVRLLNLIFYI